MIPEELAKQLHDKSTRGKSLSLEEQDLLEQWYAFQDQAETQTLAKSYDETRLFMLQTQVNIALSQLMEVILCTFLNKPNSPSLREWDKNVVFGDEGL